MKEHIQKHLCAKLHACMIKCTHYPGFYTILLNYDVRLGFCLPEWSLDYYVVMGIIYSNACEYYLVYLDTNLQKEAEISCV